MLHAVQNGYELYGTTLKGYREGTATTYGVTIDQGGTISVRSYIDDETQKLSDFLTTYIRGTNKAMAYANQDFFAYVAKKHGGNSLAYLADLFETLSDGINTYSASQTDLNKRAAYKKQPPWNILFDAMDDFFFLTYGLTLEEVYLDFLKQRVFDHNTESQFGRTGETTSGFASGLFQTSTTRADNAFETAAVNAETCNIIDGSGTFANVAPYASRAIDIITSTADPLLLGKKLTVTLTPATGSVGTTWQGYYNKDGATTALSANATEIESFGGDEDDEVDFVFSNVTTDTPMYVEYAVTCGDTPAPVTGAFTITGFSLPGETFSPAYETTGLISSYVGNWVSESSQAESNWTSGKYLLTEFLYSQITGPGTYSIAGCYGDSGGHGDATMIFQVASGGNVYCAASGTLTLTSFGTSTGDHITGSLTATMEKVLDTDSTGSISATFDLTVGDSNVAL